MKIATFTVTVTASDRTNAEDLSQYISLFQDTLDQEPSKVLAEGVEFHGFEASAYSEFHVVVENGTIFKSSEAFGG